MDLQLKVNNMLIVEGTAYKVSIYAMLLEVFPVEVSKIDSDYIDNLDLLFDLIVEQTRDLPEAEEFIYKLADYELSKVIEILDSMP
jgi:hypothetical protein